MIQKKRSESSRLMVEQWGNPGRDGKVSAFEQPGSLVGSMPSSDKPFHIVDHTTTIPEQYCLLDMDSEGRLALQLLLLSRSACSWREG